jgi:hypothetical protein
MIIENAELWFCKLDPKRPSARFNKENPTWECQIRTKDKNVKKLWESLGLNVKAVVPDEGDPYFRVNLRKKSIKVDGEPASPVTVVDGSLQPVDPKTIGNGSVGNVKVFQYDFPQKGGGKGLASVLMGVQLTKHLVYEPRPRDDDFGETITEVIEPDDEETEEFSTTPPL